ncbi:MAG: hypothetical protein GY761_17795, partial [Hyphomicrobiales bacterium]|nr:hypothetical protein [Hyphomicrobiales bacterium]
MRKRLTTSIVTFYLILLLIWGRAPTVRAATPSVFINEILVSNVSVNLDPDYTEFSDWIELYNAETSQINLSGYYLTDDLSVPDKWRIPSGTQIDPGGYLLFWADGQDDENHTDFKLKHDGEVVALFDSSEDLVDSVSFGAQLPDISYGRQPDGTANWVYFGSPSPDGGNGSDGIPGQILAPQPQFDLSGGFYSGNQTVTLTTPSPTAEIRYSLDGTIPSSSSTQFSSPIAVGTTTVLRARVYDTDQLPSPVATHTYLIDESVTLPVVAVATDPANLWDDEIGIYVEGTNGITGKCSDDPVNWNQDWERPSNVALYELDSSLAFQLDAGIEIFGGCTRIYNRKSLTVRGRDKYGLDRIQSQLFSDKQVSSFRSLVLRNSGNDARLTLFRDAMMQELLKGQMDIDWQGYRPVVMFLNGAYWGIHNVREKIDEDYVESNYDIESNTIDLLESNSEIFVGSDDHYQDLLDYIDDHGLTQSQ